MPIVRGLEISVQTKNGTLPEYGTMRLGSGSIFSTFIQSEDKTPFQINFRPSNIFAFNKPLDQKWDRHTAKIRPTIWRPQEGRHWDFSAHIFIDDNPKADKNLIIDLPRHGKSCETVTARGRSCIDSNGRSAEQEWMFNEVPVEDQLAKLTTDENMEDEWEADSSSETENDVKMGQIKIQLFRIRQCGTDKTRKSEKRSATRQSQSQTNSSNEISHTIGVGEAKPRLFHYITVDYLDGPRVPWATVIFMYRGKKQLQKMGLILEKHQVQPDNFRSSEPGPSTKFNSTLPKIYRYSDSPSDVKLLQETRSTSSTLLPPAGNNMPGTNAGKCPELFPLGSSNLDIRPTSFLKRKPDHEVEISASLSAMSLTKKGYLTPHSQTDQNSLKGKSEWRMNTGNESTDDETVCLKKIKIKRTGPDGDEEIL